MGLPISTPVSTSPIPTHYEDVDGSGVPTEIVRAAPVVRKTAPTNTTGADIPPAPPKTQAQTRSVTATTASDYTTCIGGPANWACGPDEP